MRMVYYSVSDTGKHSVSVFCLNLLVVTSLLHVVTSEKLASIWKRCPLSHFIFICTFDIEEPAPCIHDLKVVKRKLYLHDTDLKVHGKKKPSTFSNILVRFSTDNATC